MRPDDGAGEHVRGPLVQPLRPGRGDAETEERQSDLGDLDTVPVKAPDHDPGETGCPLLPVPRGRRYRILSKRPSLSTTRTSPLLASSIAFEKDVDASDMPDRAGLPACLHAGDGGTQCMLTAAQGNPKTAGMRPQDAVASSSS